jgi:hypothetical protein
VRKFDVTADGRVVNSNQPNGPTLLRRIGTLLAHHDTVTISLTKTAPAPPPAVKHAKTAYVSWALQRESGHGFTDPALGGCNEATFAMRCASKGVTEVLLQALPENEPHYAPLRSELAARGITFGLWGVIPAAADAAALARRTGASVYVAQTEEDAETEEGFVAKFKAAAPNVELRSVTTFVSFRAEWLACDVDVEAYVCDQPWNTVEAFVKRAIDLGWREAQVKTVLGGFPGKALDGSDLPQSLYTDADLARPNTGVYLADTLTGKGWERW